jgi:hypothetical protein
LQDLWTSLQELDELKGTDEKTERLKKEKTAVARRLTEYMAERGVERPGRQ